MGCIEINDKNLISWLFWPLKNEDKANLIVDYFYKEGRGDGELPPAFIKFITKLKEKLVTQTLINRYTDSYLFFKKLAQASPVENTSQESSSGMISADLILDTKQMFIDDVFTFKSKHEGLNKLFKDKDHIYQKYSWFMSKYLIADLFYNNKQTKQISNSQDLKAHLVNTVNFYASVLDPNKFTTDDADKSRKVFLKINYDGTNMTITYDKSDWYYINNIQNNILKNADFNILKDLKYGPIADINKKKLVTAISYANFNTVIQEYLPGVITVNSNLPGFDLLNINNDEIYVLNGSSQGKGWQSEGKVFDSNSNLAKLLLNSFETITAYKDRNGNFAINFENNPNFSVALYYYVSQFLSKHINKQNYANEFNQLLTALMQFNVSKQNDSLLNDLARTRPESIGRFTYDYVDSNLELKEIFQDTTLYSVIATLYYNMATTENDPIFNKANFTNDIEQAANKKVSLVKIYKRHINSTASSIHDLIFATLQGTTERLYHDLVYDFEKRVFTSKSLSQTVINKSIFEVQKMHRNLISLSDERRNSLFPEIAVTDQGLNILVDGKTEFIPIVNKRWGLVYGQTLNQIYEIFYQLTNFDLSSDFILKQNPAFSVGNILSVIYGMMSINDNADAKTKYKEEKKALGAEKWSEFCPVGNVNSILYNMGAQYGKLTGVMSKMTILNKEGKQLPTFGMKNISSSYEAYLHESRNQPVLQGNIFNKNPKLYQGSSVKNQIVKDGDVINFREQNEKDAIIFDMYYEWLQKHFYNTALTKDQNTLGDGIFSIQPLVPADKVNQNVIKINAGVDINYDVLSIDNQGTTRLNKFVSKDTLNSLPTDYSAIRELKDAQFFSLGAQHKSRRDKIIQSLNNVLIANNLPQQTDLVVQFDTAKNVAIATGTTLESELFRHNPGINLTKELYFNTIRNKDGAKEYILNGTQLFFFDLFDVSSSQSHVPNRDAFNKYHNLGIFEFLYKLKKLNIDATSTNIFPQKDYKSENINNPTNKIESILHDLNLVLKEDQAIEDLYNTIQIAIENNDRTQLFSDELQQKIEGFLKTTSQIYQQYYWENILFGQNYEMSVNGPIYLHPQKDLPNKPTFYSETLARLAVSQKRNVDYSATVIPYTYGLNGPARTRNVFVYQDIKRKVSNPMGDEASVDIHDGGELILLLHRILENNSMQGYSNPIFHKSLIHGRMINQNGEFEDSMLFKYASYQLTGQKLRSSRKLRNMAQYALSQELEFSSMKNVLWNFAKDYNDNGINYADYHINVKTDAGNRYKTLLNLVKGDGDNYIVTWQDQEGKVTSETKTINNLYDLYKILGAERTVNINKQKEIIEYNENAWAALQDVCCKVGFKLTDPLLNSEIGIRYAQLSGVTLEDLRLNKNNSIINQQNVIQPLKFSYITQFTPESCIKYGAIIGNATNDFTIKKTDPNETDEDQTTRVLNDWKVNHRLMRVYDMLGGVQQDAEHEGDEATEPTQMINGAALDNQTPEYLDLYKHIANYVIGKMTKTYPGETQFLSSPEEMQNDDYFMTHMRQLAFIYDKLEKQILNSSYDNGNTAAVVLASALNFSKDFIKLDKEYKDEDPNKISQARDLAEKFTVSLSHPSVYNMVLTALAAANTKLGIRRMGAGMAGVQQPHGNFMNFIAIPQLETVNYNLDLDDGNFMASSSGKLFNYDNYTTMTPDQFVDYMSEHPEYQELTRDENRYSNVWSAESGIQVWNLNLYNHYEVINNNGEIEQIYVKDVNALKNLKFRIYNNEFSLVRLDKLAGYDWSQNAGRDLKHIDFEIVVKPTDGRSIIYNIYDTVANDLLYRLQSLDWEDTVLRNSLINEFFTVVKTYPQLEMFTKIKNINNKKEFANILRALLNIEYKLISVGNKLITPEDKQFIAFVNQNVLDDEQIITEDKLKQISSVKSIDSEIIMSLPAGAKFGITNMKHASDITVESIMKDLDKKYYEVEELLLLDKNGKKYKMPYFFQADNGNIYLTDENISTSGLESVEPYIYIEDNKKYITIANKQILEVTSDLEGKLRIQYTKNNTPVLVLLSSKQEMNAVKTAEGLDHFNTNVNTTFWSALQENINQVNLSENVCIRNDPNQNNSLNIWLDAADIGDFTNLDKKKQLAREMYASYQAVLRFASTRIPGQSYQSFASTRIGNFLHGEQNAIYVNDYTIWLTGGDYDIDKLFNIGFKLSEGGKFIGWHKFFKALSYEHLKESLKLPGQHNEVTYKENGLDLNDIYFTEGDRAITGIELIKQVLTVKTNSVSVHSQVAFQKFKAFVQLYNQLLTQGYKNEDQNEFIKQYLNHDSVINYKAPDEGLALQNRMISQVRNNLSDIRNVIPTYSPISVGEAPKMVNGKIVEGFGPKALKFTSDKYIQSQSGHPDVPLKRIQDINNQSSGKSVVGIMAAGLKLYATISYVVEDMLYKNQSVSELESMMFSHNITTKDKDDNIVVINVSNGFAGINYEINKDLYTEQLVANGMDIDQVNQEFINHYKRDSVQLNISQLLSAATDNGKEMILGIINSGKDTQGVYTYALMTGISLEEIGALMTSKEIDFIINNTKRSVLLNDPYKTMFDVGNYFLNPIAIDTFVPFNSKKDIIPALGLSGKTEDLSNLSIEVIEKAVKASQTALKKLEITNKNDEEFDYMDDEMGFGNTNTVNAYASLQNYIKSRKEIEALLLEPKTKDNVKLFLTYLHNAQLFASTTQVLGANQRVKPSDRELIRFYVSIEDSIKNYPFRIASKQKGVQPSEYINSNNDWMKSDKRDLPEHIKIFLQKFNLWEFMQKSEEEAKKDIQLFDEIKSDINPLQVFYYAEHFREMIKTVLMTDAILKKQSIVYRSVADFQENKLLTFLKTKEKSAVYFKNQTTVDVQKKVVYERNLGTEAFSVLKNIMDDKFILESLFLLQNRLTRENKVIYITDVDGNAKQVNLQLLKEENNILGRREFIQFMEETLIPRLKLGKINDTSDNTINPKIRKNAFITSMQIKDFTVRNKKGESFLAYGIANFKSSDNLQVKLNQNELMIALYDLNNLDDSKYKPTPNSNGTSIIDLLFLYNIILHRGKDGEFTLSSFFDPTKLPESIVSKFYMQENQVNNAHTNYLEITKQDLRNNGFDDELIPKLEIGQTRFSQDYRYINVGNATNVEERRNLEEKIKTLFETGFIGNKIKFDCI